MCESMSIYFNNSKAVGPPLEVVLNDGDMYIMSTLRHSTGCSKFTGVKIGAEIEIEEKKQALKDAKEAQKKKKEAELNAKKALIAEKEAQKKKKEAELNAKKALIAESKAAKLAMKEAKKKK